MMLYEEDEARVRARGRSCSTRPPARGLVFDDEADEYLSAARGFQYIYYWRASFMRPVDRKGQRCRVLALGKRNTVAIEFEDAVSRSRRRGNRLYEGPTDDPLPARGRSRCR